MFDINTAIGHWPFRSIPNQVPRELRTLLKKRGIEGAAVANTNGLFYKNCHDANLELAEWIAPYRSFFVGVATLNPAYAAWERDICTCKEKLGFRALRLAPQYHDYALGSSQAVAIAKAASGLAMPILVPQRVVDPRQRHWFDTERTIAFDEIAALCNAVPEARIIVTETSFGGGQLLKDGKSVRFPNLYLESSRAGIGGLPRKIAAARIVFGTGAPFKCVTPSLLKLENADLDERSRKRIAEGNAKSLLGLPGGSA